MTLLYVNNLSISVSQVLRAQGMDPDSVYIKRPKIIELTEKAIQIGYEYLTPKAVYASNKIDHVRHNQIILDNGRFLSGELIGKILPKAEKVYFVVCTVGNQISEIAISLFSSNPALAMAVEGMAAASTEILGNHLCHIIDELAVSEGFMTSTPINPGMIGWRVEEGQPQIFSCLDTSPIGVTLDSTGLMKPLKTLSMAIGVGKNIDNQGITCDYCSLQKTCTHKSIYSNNENEN